MSVLFCTVILLQAQDTTEKLLKTIADYYRSSVPFRVGFTVRQTLPHSKNYSETNGYFYLGEQNRFRVEFPDQVIVWDGKWLWTRETTNRQVIVENFNPRSSLKIIADLLNGTLDGYKIIKTNPKTKTIDLKPTSEGGYIKSMHLKINDNKTSVSAASYQDFQNNSIIIGFDTLTCLSPADTGLFRIQVQKNEELIDLRS